MWHGLVSSFFCYANKDQIRVGWKYDLKDEVLCGFGLAKSAKGEDSWSSWNLKGAARLPLLFFYFWCCLLFASYGFWFCIFHCLGAT